MGVVQWGALVIGIVLVAWPVFQALSGRPQLSFAFDRAGDHSGCVLQVHIRNQPVESAFLLQLGVKRDDANFSLSMLVLDERGNEILKYPEGREAGRLHLPGGSAPLTLRLVSCDMRGARLRGGDAEGSRELAPGTYSLRLTVSFTQRKPAAQRMFVVTQRKLDSYWADA
jgi:hypothetical protein